MKKCECGKKINNMPYSFCAACRVKLGLHVVGLVTGNFDKWINRIDAKTSKFLIRVMVGK